MPNILDEPSILYNEDLPPGDATSMTPKPRLSSPLSPSQRHLPARRTFPLSTHKVSTSERDLYRKALKYKAHLFLYSQPTVYFQTSISNAKAEDENMVDVEMVEVAPEPSWATAADGYGIPMSY